MSDLLRAENSALERRLAAQTDLGINGLLLSDNFQESYNKLFIAQLTPITGSLDISKSQEIIDKLSEIELDRKAQINLISTITEELVSDSQTLVNTGCGAFKNDSTRKQLNEVILKLPVDKVDKVKLKLSSLEKECKKLLDTNGLYEEKLSNLGTKIKDAIRRRNIALEAISKNKQDAQKLQLVYEAQLKEYTALTKNSSNAGIQKELKDVIGKIEKIADELKNVPGGFGQKILSESRVDQLDQVLRVLSGELPKEGANLSSLDSVASVSLILSLTEDVASSKEQAKKILVTPLLISLQHQKLLAEASSNRVKFEEQKVDMLHILVDSMLEQLESLSIANKHYDMFLASAKLEKLDTDMPTVKVFQNAKQNRKDRVNTKFDLYSAVVHLFDSTGRLDLETQRIEQSLVALEHEAALNQSEIAVQMWNSLITNSIEQLKQFHAKGIKPENIAELLQALGLILIGNGVN